MNIINTMRVLKKISVLNEHESHILAFGLYKALQDKGMMNPAMLASMIENIKKKAATTKNDPEKTAQLRKELDAINEKGEL